MYYKKKNTNLKLMILIGAIGITILFGLIFIIMQVAKNNKRTKEKIVKEQGELAIPEIKITNLNEKEKDVMYVTLKIEAKTDDPDGIDYVIDEKTNERYKDLPVEIMIDKNDIYTYKVVAKNTKTKEAKIQVTQIKEVSANKPYIPKKFKHVEGTTVEQGYIIKDEVGNEFVWIPVENGKLPLAPFNESGEYRDEDAGMFNNSVAKNYGFYVARFEAGINDDMMKAKVPVSKPDVDVWTGITHEQAKEMSKNVAKENGYASTTYTSLITGGAWRAILDFAEKEKQGYTKSTEYGNYWNGIQRAGSGNDVVKSIYNLAGNLREWTDEIYLRDTRTEEEKKNGITELSNRILRGGSGNIAPFTPEYRTHARVTAADDYWGFRFILFEDRPNIHGKTKEKEEKENKEENKKEEDKEKEQKDENKKEQENNEEKKDNKKTDKPSELNLLPIFKK